MSPDPELPPAGPLLRTLAAHGVIEARGSDFHDLLHRLSASDTRALARDTPVTALLVTDKGRVLDLALACVHDDAVLVLTSPERTARVLAWFETYTIMEDVVYRDASADWRQYEWRRGTGDLFASFNDVADPALPATIDIPYRNATGAGLRMLVAGADAAAFEAGLGSRIAAVGGCAISEQDFDLLRIRASLPAVGRELTERVNPIEAGAGSDVSFTKGCYIGQEVIARLDTYNKVQRHLRPLLLRGSLPDDPIAVARAIPSGTALTSEGRDGGFLTSCAYDPDTRTLIGLGCIRLAFERPGTILQLEAHALDMVVQSPPGEPSS